MTTQMSPSNPLAEPLVGVLQQLRKANHEREAYRELLLLTLGLLGDSERELRQIKQRHFALIDRVRDDRQAA
jgi:hypothetical protein